MDSRPNGVSEKMTPIRRLLPSKASRVVISMLKPTREQRVPDCFGNGGLSVPVSTERPVAPTAFFFLAWRHAEVAWFTGDPRDR